MVPLFILSLALEVIGTDNRTQQQFFLHLYITDRAKRVKQWQIVPFQNCSYSSLYHSCFCWHVLAVRCSFNIAGHQRSGCYDLLCRKVILSLTVLSKDRKLKISFYSWTDPCYFCLWTCGLSFHRKFRSVWTAFESLLRAYLEERNSANWTPGKSCLRAFGGLLSWWTMHCLEGCNFELSCL